MRHYLIKKKIFYMVLFIMAVAGLSVLCGCFFESQPVDNSGKVVVYAPHEEESNNAEEFFTNLRGNSEEESVKDIGDSINEQEKISEEIPVVNYTFRKEKYLTEHFEKHGAEFPYDTKEDYLAGANRVIASPDALTKTEAEDGDYVFYLEETNEFVILSTDGHIRTYFKPSGGKAYYDRQ